jgi:ATP-dependent helicase/nuclease subunit A
MNLTNEQKKAVSARGNVLVSAAAGSGKTAVLTARVIDRILGDTDPVDVDKLLIVTFTNAAAVEMNKRISDELQKIIDRDSGNIRAARQKLLLDSATICTIDSFCNNLVRENFQYIDIKPDFTISNEEQLESLSVAAMDLTVDKCYVENDAAFFELLDIFGGDENDEPVRDAVKKIYSFTQSLPYPEQWFDKIINDYSDISLEKSEWFDIMLGECAKIVSDVLPDCINTIKMYENADFGKALDSIAYCCDQFKLLDTLISDGDWDGAFNLCSSFKAPNMRFPKGTDESEKQPLKDKLGFYKKTIEIIKSNLCASSGKCIETAKKVAPHIIKLINIVREYSDNLIAVKHEKNQYEFADIERFALNLLVNFSDGDAKQTELAKSICGNYAEVMVDEYQDTNDLQNAIFNAVSDNGKNLFTVGDVKQCIYNFRKANPLNFLNKKNSYKLYDGNNDVDERYKIILSGNFRSCPAVCNCVNFLFERLMTKSIAEMDYLDEDRLVPLGSFCDEDKGEVGFNIIDSTDDERNDDELQIHYIIDYINRTVDREQISVNGEMRPIQYSDFLIMTRSGKSKIVDYVEAFKKAGIPVSAEVSSDFFSLPEIVTVLNLLRVISNPLNDVAMLSVSLSPLFSITPDEVANIRFEHQKVPLYSAFTASDNIRVQSMLGKIELYRRLAASVTVSLLISRIYDDSLLPHTYLATDGGEQKRANLMYLIEFAKGFEKNNSGLTSFVSQIDRALAGKNSVVRKYTVGDADSVRIMTIHHSKGLQAPICFVINTSTRFNENDSSRSLTVHAKYGLGIKVCDSQKRIKADTLPRKAVAQMITNDMLAEEIRLLYVAMTRAQNRLIFLSVDKKVTKRLENALMNEKSTGSLNRCRSFYEWLLNIVLPQVNIRKLIDDGAAQCIDCDDFTIARIDSEQVPEPRVCLDTGKEKIRLDYDSLNERLNYVYPYSNILNINSKFSASGLAERDNDKMYYCTRRPRFMNSGGLTSAERGTLMHRFMEKCDMNRAAIDVDAEIDRLILNGVFSTSEAAGIDRGKISAFFDDEVFSIIKSADKVLRESRFIYEMPISEIDESIVGDETVTVQGIADCVVISDGKITVIDYKTDRVKGADELVSRYSSQLKLYAKAMHNTYDMPVNDCIIYSFELKRGVSLGFSL